MSFELTVTNNGPDSASGVDAHRHAAERLTWRSGRAPNSSSRGAVHRQRTRAKSDRAVDCWSTPTLSRTRHRAARSRPARTARQTLRCDIGQLDADGSFSVTVTSNATTTCGMVTNEDAAVTADTPDPDTENNVGQRVGRGHLPAAPAPTPARLHPERPRRDHDHDVDDDHDHDDDPGAAGSLSPSLRLPRRRPLLRLRRSFRRSWSARSSRPRRHLRPRFRRLRCLPRPDPSRPGPQSRRPTWCFAPSTRRRRPAESSA